MGACNFITIGFGKTIEEAFQNATNDAIYEHGHDCYNGTISTTKLVGRDWYSTKRKRMDTIRNYAWQQTNDENVRKWESKGFEVTGKNAKTLKREYGLARTHKKVFMFYGWAGC